ncbi:Bud site selection protein 6 [Coemansia sp. IMI 203386]|nr:Bud site selection protein 6 [Coemansia sp. IMI 203386]
MNRNDYTQYSGYTGRSPEPTSPGVTAYGTPNIRSVPSITRPYANGYGTTTGSLRNTRNSTTVRTDSVASRPIPQGSLRRAHLGTFDDSTQQQLHPYVPDANERRTPDFFHSNQTGARSTPPMANTTTPYHDTENIPRSSSIQKYRANEYEERNVTSSPSDPYRYSRRGSNASNQSIPPNGLRMVDARKSPGPTRMFPASQRVELSYAAPVRATIDRSMSPERDEIADIIADMSKKTPINEDGEFYVFLQLDQDTKKARVSEKPLSMTTLVNLFIDKYRDRLVQGIPSVYIRDPETKVFYELEDMTEVVRGSVLSWKVQPIVSEQQKEETKVEESKKDVVLKELAETVDGLVKAVAKLPGQLQEEVQAMANDVKRHSDDALAAIDAKLLKQSSIDTDQNNTPVAVSVSSTAEPMHLSRSASLPASAHNSAHIDELKTQIRQLELSLSIERQERKESEHKLEETKNQAVESLAKLQKEVSSHPNILRTRIEEGKIMLKTEYRQLNSRFEDLDTLIQEMRKDVTQRGSIPSASLMKKAATEISDISQGTDKLRKFINDTRADWKRTWEEELQNILKEQGFVKDVEQMIGELIDDTEHLNGILSKLDKIIDFRLEERSKSDYIPTAATRFIDVVSADDARDAKTDFLKQIACVDVDHQKRLEALKTAEKLRSQELATKVNEFDQELSDFVGQRKLRKTGGTEELERRRAEKNVEVMKDMLKSVEEAEQARRAKIAQRKAAKPNMDFQPVNPRPFLQSQIGSPVVVQLKWGQEYKGVLSSIDSYMNLQLANAEEFQDGNSTGELQGELLIRCNNVLYVREITKESDNMSADESDQQQHTSHGTSNRPGRQAKHSDDDDDDDEQMEDGEE